jgi:hypothetical protein
MARRIVGGGEQDAYTGWRKVMCYLQRAGVVKKIKRGTHKRERREARREIERWREGR